MARPQTRSLAVLQRRFFMTLSRDLRMAEDSLWDGKVFWLAADWFWLCWKLLSATRCPVFLLLLSSVFCSFIITLWLSHFGTVSRTQWKQFRCCFSLCLQLPVCFFASFVSLAGTSDAHLSSWWSFCKVIEVVIICASPALFCLLVFFAVLSQLCRLIIVVAGYLWKFIWICVNSRSSNQDNDNRLLLSEGYRSNFADLARKHVALKWTPQRSSVEEDRGLYARRNRGRDG